MSEQERDYFLSVLTCMTVLVRLNACHSVSVTKYGFLKLPKYPRNLIDDKWHQGEIFSLLSL